MKHFIFILLLLENFLYTNSSAVIYVAVFCSADDKVASHYKNLTYRLGELLGKDNYGLITGGSRTGLMKEVIDGYNLSASSVDNLYGVLPKVLEKYNIHHPNIAPQNFFWVDTLHLRLMHFHQRADIVVILPGGFGTLHELMDFLVHNQFGLIKKKIILVNMDGYWNNLLAQFKVMLEEKLLAPQHFAMLSIVTTAEECIQSIALDNASLADQGLESLYWNK